MKLEDLTFEVRDITEEISFCRKDKKEIGVDTYRLFSYLGHGQEVGHITFRIMAELKDSQCEGDSFFFDKRFRPHKPRPYLMYMGVKEGFKGNQVAGWMIKHVNDFCNSQFDATFYSGTQNKPNAIRVWEKLVDEGVAFECKYDGKRRWGFYKRK
jgi:hypothetical protein